MTNSTDEATHVGDVPVCVGCGLAGEVNESNGLCKECFDRGNWNSHMGMLRVVTESMTYHETPLCPAVKNANVWFYWRDEACCYADLGGDMDKCIRCHSFRTYGFDEFVGDEDSQVVIGHA